MEINWFTPIYLAAIYGLVRFFVGKHKVSTEQKIHWTPLESIGVSLFIYFISQIIGGLVAYGVSVIVGHEPKLAADWLESNVVGQFVLILSIELVTGWLLLTFLKNRGNKVADIGLKGKPGWKDLGYVALGFFIYLFLFIVVASIAQGLIPGLNVDQEQDIAIKDPARTLLPLVFVSLVLLPAFFEELVVRGFLYSGLRQGMKRFWAVFITSALFGIAHLQAGSGNPLLWIAAIDTFVLSLVLIYIREKSGKLWAPIGLHMVKNSLAFISLYLAIIIR